MTGIFRLPSEMTYRMEQLKAKLSIIVLFDKVCRAKGLPAVAPLATVLWYCLMSQALIYLLNVITLSHHTRMQNHLFWHVPAQIYNLEP